MPTRAAQWGLLSAWCASVLQVPQLELPPEWREGLTLQDNVTVTAGLAQLLHAMIRRMNAASSDLPQLRPLPA